MDFNEYNARNEQIASYYEFLTEWTPGKDVWALKYFGFVTSMTTTFPAFYIFHRIRKVLNLKRHGIIVSFLPVVVLPSIASAVAHYGTVISPMLSKEHKCPLCLQLKSGLMNVLSGTVYPSLFAPVVGFWAATRYLTYPVPVLVKEPKASLELLMKFYRPIGRNIGLIVALQFAVGMALTYFEQQNLYTVVDKIAFMQSVRDEEKQQRAEENKKPKES